jgi:hypothetical protein
MTRDGKGMNICMTVMKDWMGTGGTKLLMGVCDVIIRKTGLES